MVEMRLGLLMLLAHLLGDFVLQDEKIMQMRFPKNLNQILKRSKVYGEVNGYKLKQTNWLATKQIFAYTSKGNIIHAGIHGLLLMMCIGLNNLLTSECTNTKFFKVIFINCDVKLVSLVISFIICHFLIDILKVEISYRYPQTTEKIGLFILDQMAHLLSLYGLIKYYSPYKGMDIMGLITSPISFMQQERLIWVGINFIGMTFFLQGFLFRRL